MANSYYYGTLFQSNGTLTVLPTAFSGTLPALATRGVAAVARGSIAFTAILTATDILHLARVPAGHRLKSLRFQFGVLDASTDNVVKVGVAADGTTYDDDDCYVDDSILFRAAASYVFPVAGAIGTGNPVTWATGPAGAGTPDIDYNVQMVFGTVGASTATSGTIYYEIEYVCDPTVYDDSDAPAVVAGTQ